VIIDNLRSQKVVAVREAIEATGATLMFIPPYSPDLNSIEIAFAKLKTLLRANAIRAVEAEQDGSAFIAIPGVDLNEILCEQEDGQVGKDNTVAFNTLRPQIPPCPLRAHFVHARVKVRQHMIAVTLCSTDSDTS
jgi:hypothetical protein